VKPVYSIYVCPQCDEQNQFAGFCDTCNLRLVLVPCVPTERIREFAGEGFVRRLSEWSSHTRSG
jgi:primosomal protein N'